MTRQRSVVDSSGWIELFTDGLQADRFLTLPDVEDPLVVPAISILEVFKWALREHSEAKAIQAAAQLSHALKLPMADSIMLATARAHQARLYTMDADFKGLSDVELIQRS